MQSVLHIFHDQEGLDFIEIPPVPPSKRRPWQTEVNIILSLKLFSKACIMLMKKDWQENLLGVGLKFTSLLPS